MTAPSPEATAVDVSVHRAKAATNAVVDDADVLHERIDARGPDEAVALYFNCFANSSDCGVEVGRSASDCGAR